METRKFEDSSSLSSFFRVTSNLEKQVENEEASEG